MIKSQQKNGHLLRKFKTAAGAAGAGAGNRHRHLKCRLSLTGTGTGTGTFGKVPVTGTLGAGRD